MSYYYEVASTKLYARTGDRSKDKNEITSNDARYQPFFDTLPDRLLRSEV